MGSEMCIRDRFYEATGTVRLGHGYQILSQLLQVYLLPLGCKAQMNDSGKSSSISDSIGYLGRALLVNAQQLGLDINSISADSFYLIEYILGDIC